MSWALALVLAAGPVVQWALATPTTLSILVMLPLSDPSLGPVFRNISDVMSVAPAVMSTIDPYHNYQLVFEDSASVRSTAVNAYTNATNAHTIHALVGEYSSRVTLGLALAANPRKLWHCGVASAVDFDNKVDFPYMFRVAANDNQQGPAMAQFVYAMGWRFVNVFAVADPFGQSLATTFAVAAANLGIEIYTQQQYQPGTTQFGTYLDAIQASGSKIILFMGFPGDFKLILQQAKLRGMLGSDWVWIGTGALAMYLDTLTAASDKANAQGMLFAFIREDRTGAQFQTLQAQFQAQFPSRSTSSLAGFSLLLYDCLLALAHGFNKMTTTYGDAAVQSRSYSAPLADFLVPFNATTGPVEYTAAGSRIADWQIQNVQGSSNRLVYQLWRNGTLGKVSDPVFYGGSTVVPADRAPLAILFPQWTDPGVQALAVVRALMIVLMLCGMGYLVLHRSEKQIKQLSLPFLLVISVGCILILVSEYILVGVPAVPACHSSSVVLTIGYELVFASALVKTYRIYRIFDNTRINKGGVKSKDLFRKIAIIIAVQVVLFIIWIAAFPVAPKLVTTKFSLYYECRPTNFAGHWGVLGFSFVYNFVLLFLVCYFAYKTRNVDSGYRETAWIMYTAQNVCLCSIIIIPLSLFTIESIALAAYFIRAVVMLYAVGFTFMALVGRLVVAVAADHRHAAPTSPKVLTTSPLGTAQEIQFGSKNIKASAVTADAVDISPNLPRKSVSSGAVGAPASDLNGTYPVLRRGGGLSLLQRFMTTWRSTHVNLNFARGIVAILPPSPTTSAAPTSRGRSGSVRAAATAAATAAANASSSARKMGDVFPIASLGFDTSPAGAPSGCIELVHVPTGAAWVVQLSTEEVAIWAQALKAVAVVVTTAGGGSSSGRSSSNGGQPGSAPGSAVGASGTTVAAGNSGGNVDGQSGARSRSPSAVRPLQPGAGGVEC